MRSIWALTALFLTACGEAGRLPDTVVRDSAGVTIVENRAPSGSMAPVVGEVLTRIGGAGTELNRVVTAVRLSDGRVVVADDGDAALRAFGPEGEASGSFGRPGDGPAEFRMLQAMGLQGVDTVWAYDFVHQRFSIVGPSLTLDREITLRTPVSAGLAVGRLRNGTFLVGEAWSPGIGDAGEGGIVRGRVAYVRFDSTGSLIDTVAVIAGREVLLRSEGGRGVMSAVPFARSASHAVVGPVGGARTSGSAAPAGVPSPRPTAFVLGDQSTYELRFFTAEGDPVRIVRWAGGGLAIDQEALDAWQALRLSQAAPGEREALRRSLLDLPLPPTRPAYGPLLPTPSGGLWVGSDALPGQSPSSWEIFDAGGTWIATVRPPDGFHPLSIGDGWIVGVTRDAFDVEEVEVRALR